MTPLAERSSAPASEARVLWLIGAAHFVSHYYLVVLAPLFGLIRGDLGVSYTELGFALTVLNVTSAIFQTPAGFLVDRTSPRAVLVAGLLIGAAGLAGAALFPTYLVFLAMFALLGIGNTAYHPADYALLSRHISGPRMGPAYSFHGFAGMAGGAAAPPILLLMTGMIGWRGAYLAAALLGVAVAVALMLFGQALAEPGPATRERKSAEVQSTPASGGSILLSVPILLNLVFFTLLSIYSGAVQNFSVVALDALHGTPLEVGNTALAAYLAFSAIGVLLGGYVAARTHRHDLVTVLTLVIFAAGVLPIGLIDTGAALLVVLISIAGAASGAIMPSRDMLVRAVTPPGAFGRVFGFVTNGFNIGGMVTPLIFGWLLDSGHPRAVFIGAAAISLICIPIVLITVARGRSGG
jgi:MFS family permease